MTMTRPASGVAYGVFRCTDSRPAPALLARFKEALDNIKLAHEETKIPPETKFSVFGILDGVTHVRKLAGAGTGSLLEKISALEKAGANYIIRSALPDAPNAIAARDLGDTLNMLYWARNCSTKKTQIPKRSSWKYSTKAMRAFMFP
jgi:hypothetical protein